MFISHGWFFSTPPILNFPQKSPSLEVSLETVRILAKGIQQTFQTLLEMAAFLCGTLETSGRIAAIMKGKQPEDMRILFSYLCFFASRRHENCPFSKTEAGLRKKQGFRRAQMKTCDILWLWMLPSCWVVSPRNPKKKCCKSFPCPAFRMAEASNCLMIFVQGPAWGKFAAQVLIELRMLLVLANETTSLPNPIKHHKSTTTHRSLKQHKKSASVSQFVSDDPVKSSMMWTSLAIVQQKQRYAKCYKNGQGFHGFLGISLKWTKNSNHSMQPRGKYVGGFQLRWWHQIQHRHLVTEGLHHSDSTEKNCNFFC